MVDFNPFWKRYRRRAYATCFKFLKHECPDEVDDVLVEVESVCKRNLESKTDEQKWRTEEQAWWYIRETCKSRCLNRLKVRRAIAKAENEFLMRAEISSGESEASEIKIQRLFQANILTTVEQETLKRRMHNWTFSEIATSMNCSVRTVKRIAKKALEKARDYLKTTE